ncbi:MAG: rhomboid family intramembrane serine protease [Acidobacteriaceae bacterium]|jgi:membrane associated rhomboid family serine protease
MARSSTIPMSFPPFAGVVRKLVLANVAVYFALLVLGWLAGDVAGALVDLLRLQPAAVARGEVWQLATYCFIHTGLWEILFAMLTLWFCGSLLEGAYGSRWLKELYFTSAIGGAAVASAISFTHLLGLRPESVADGAWAGIFGVMIAIAVRMGDAEFLLFPLPFSIRAKYMVTIYILIAVAILLKDANAFGALLQLSGALAGWLYVRYAPRRGLAFGFGEQFFGMRNAYYRAKRRRAARKFEVYMGKQGRKVHFDEEGRFVEPDEKRDPNDKRWMN